jgi:hypothetical protein
LEVLESQPIGSAFEPDIEIPHSGKFIGGQDEMHELGSAGRDASGALSFLRSVVWTAS